MIFCFWWAIAFLFGMLWQLIKAIWWVVLLVLIGYWILSHTNDWKPLIKRHYKKILLFIVSTAVIVVIVWGLSSTKSSNVIVEPNIASVDSIITEPIDTAKIIADQRKDSIFEGNIFAGLRFGISKGEYQRLINNFKREYDNKIVFPNEKGNVLSYRISGVEPKFYRGKLYAVEVKIDNHHAYYELEPVFERKYGITKNNHWKWQNAEIELSSRAPHSESVHDPTSGTGARYNIKKPGYTTIRYRDLTLYNLERKEQMQNDSIKKAKEQAAREKRRQREREQADRYKENI
ncbi:MAG: hypothetical protein BHV69_10185 [Bacteroidales bacterium 52_46]|nr:MAG: hypothetical protein BHV69_10185 [Bacteroidales bacterium 52_46]